MKTARFLFTVVVCGGFALGLSRAAEPSKSPTERDTHESHLTANRAVLPPHGNPGTTKAEQKDDSRAPEKGRQAEALKHLVKLPSVKETRPFELKRAATAYIRPPVMKEPAQRFATADETQAGNKVVTPGPGGVRTRSVPETLIGKVRISGALDGTTIMKRRP